MRDPIDRLKKEESMLQNRAEGTTGVTDQVQEDLQNYGSRRVQREQEE